MLRFAHHLKSVGYSHFYLEGYFSLEVAVSRIHFLAVTAIGSRVNPRDASERLQVQHGQVQRTLCLVEESDRYLGSIFHYERVPNLLAWFVNDVEVEVAVFVGQVICLSVSLDYYREGARRTPLVFEGLDTGKLYEML